MSAGHADSHEEVLRKIVIGEIDDGADEARAVLSECAECRERLRGLRRVAALLDSGGSERRAVLNEAARGTRAPGDDRVEPTVRALAAKSHPRRFRRVLFVLGLAASLAIVAYAVSRVVAPEVSVPPSEDLTLGAAVVCAAPVGEVSDYGTFTWRTERPFDGSFDLVVYDDADGGTRAPVVDKRRLEAPTWTPSPSDRDLLPASIRWEITARDRSSAVVGRAFARASLKPR